jgi:hypothetical protein
MRLPDILLAATLGATALAQVPVVRNAAAGQALHERFPAPPGTVRPMLLYGTFAHYLRNLPLKPHGTPVLLHDGRGKLRQDVHAAVVDMSTGRKDLQQCADAVMRLRAEYLFANGRHSEIAFDLTNGFRVPWSRWSGGERVRVAGNTCSWYGGAARDDTHAQLLRYLEFVFTYAGTLSLFKELQDAGHLPIEAGDVFIRGGSPGHAVIVLDVAVETDGSHWFLIGQSYMPAQDIHVLRNLADPASGAWYEQGAGRQLVTPEWTFAWSERKRWPQ